MGAPQNCSVCYQEFRVSKSRGAVAEQIGQSPRNWKVPRLNPFLALSFLPDSLDLFNLFRSFCSSCENDCFNQRWTRVQFYIILLKKIILLGCNLWYMVRWAFVKCTLCVRSLTCPTTCIQILYPLSPEMKYINPTTTSWLMAMAEW